MSNDAREANEDASECDLVEDGIFYTDKEQHGQLDTK